MKKIIVLVTMIAVLTGSMFAQGVPGGFVSPQNAATNGRIRSFADDFIRPDAYQNVKLENWFGFASFASDSRAALGWATKLGEDNSGPLLSLFYTGSALAGVQNSTTTERDGVTYYNPNTQLSGNPSNQIAVLLGLGNMGFRLSLISTYNSINQKDFLWNRQAMIDDDNDPNTPDVPVTITDKYKSYEVGNGLISPQIAWSMTNNLIDGVGIRPWVTLDVGFNNNFSKIQGGGDNNVIINQSANYIRPELQLGLGGITLANKNNWRTSFDFEYRLRLDLYDNEYNDTNGKVAKISGRYRPDNPATPLVNEGILEEYSWMDHRIRPSISTQWNGDKLRLRAKFDLNMTLTSADTAQQTDDNGTLKKNGDVTNAFAFGLNPDLALAAQWQVTEKFFINMGGRLNIDALTITTTDSERYTDGTAVADSKSTTTAFTFRGLSNLLTLGVTLNATDNMFFEVACGVGKDNRLDLFPTTSYSRDASGDLNPSTNNSVLSFANILVGFKF